MINAVRNLIHLDECSSLPRAEVADGDLAEYRVCLLDEHGGLGDTFFFMCHRDEDAISHPAVYDHPYGVAVWEGLRLLIMFTPEEATVGKGEGASLSEMSDLPRSSPGAWSVARDCRE